MLLLILWCVGVKRGDRVAVYMPMIVEMVVTLLACARLGVIHSVVVSVSVLLIVFHCLLSLNIIMLCFV